MRFEDKIGWLKANYDFSVTSWWRSKKHNTAVGGVPTSRHLVGLAVDVVLDNADDKPALRQTASEIGLQVIDETDHLHIQEPRSKS